MAKGFNKFRQPRKTPPTQSDVVEGEVVSEREMQTERLVPFQKELNELQEKHGIYIFASIVKKPIIADSPAMADFPVISFRFK